MVLVTKKTKQMDDDCLVAEILQKYDRGNLRQSEPHIIKISLCCTHKWRSHREFII